MLGKTELLARLDAQHIPYECEEHDAVLNMGESEKLTLSLTGARCKNLLLQDKSGACFLVMTTAAKALDLTAAAKAFGSKRLSFASAELLYDALGLRPGSLSPLALVNDQAGKVRLIIDADLAGEAAFLLHPLQNSATLAISREALERFLDSVNHAPSWISLEARAPLDPAK
ncbi:prolyl-tRNA synthetase associated domain-containing protein [Herbaspirillum chlorophenolicum]|uniref:Prolyl-tRNA synthetase associated domain-containing protein n=1 Tax=Herbaspirillum chlorophenolicum TaxID=211589 RepID=A0ABW8F219_9BURK